MKITDFITGKVEYDQHTRQYLWIKGKNGNEMLADFRMRGWGAIQNMFKRKDGTIDSDAAAKYQDEIANFIAEAINEKIERDFKLFDTINC